MLNRIFWILAIVLVTAGLLVPADAGAARKFSKKSCVDCHKEYKKEFLDRRYTHEPAEEQGCESCHLRHGVVGKVLLKTEGNALCTECHDTDALGLGGKVKHAVVEKGLCVNCHDPHGSEEKGLLKKAEADLCRKCHPGTIDGDNVHEVVADDGCGACHQVHGSDNPDLLVKKQADVCANCHDTDSRSFESRHAGYPVSEGACTSCHNPHASDSKQLLQNVMHAPIADTDCDVCPTSPR